MAGFVRVCVCVCLCTAICMHTHICQCIRMHPRSCLVKRCFRKHIMLCRADSGSMSRTDIAVRTAALTWLCFTCFFSSSVCTCCALCSYVCCTYVGSTGFHAVSACLCALTNTELCTRIRESIRRGVFVSTTPIFIFI